MGWDTKLTIIVVMGVILILAGNATFYKIYQGSKVKFAFILTTFTIMYGLVFVLMVFYSFSDISKIFNALETIYYWLSVQGWLFGVQYIESSIKSGETKFISLKQATWFKWGGVLCFSVTLIALFVLQLADLNYINHHQIVENEQTWFKKYNQFYKVYNTLPLIWLSMTLLNTFISIFGIYKVNKTVRDLIKNENKLKTNHWIQTLHGLVLLLQLGAVIYYVGFIDKKNFYFEYYIIPFSIDFLVQIIICYICWVQGSDTALKKYNCVIFTDRFGQMRLRFQQRQSQELKEEMASQLNLLVDSVEQIESEFPDNLVPRDTHGYIIDSQMLQFIVGASASFISERSFTENEQTDLQTNEQHAEA